MREDQPLRIALCADGRSPHAERWANGLADRRHEVAFVWGGDEFLGADLSSFRPSISHHVIPRRRPTRPWSAALAQSKARGLARLLRPDLVHGLLLTGHGWNAHAFGVQPLVLSALGSDVLELRRRGGATLGERAIDAYRVRLTRAAVAAAAVVLADSEAIASVVRERVPGAVTQLVRFGVETTLPPPGARAAWRRRLDIGDDAFVLLSTRLMRPLYNIDTIIRAFATVRGQLPQAVLVLKELPRFTDPDYRRLCLDLIDELDIGHAVRTVGELERGELLELYAAADVYLSVPDRDGTAVSVLESMAAGVPVVATDAPGIDKTILRHDETALLVPTRDADSVASAVATVAFDADRRRGLVERAGATVQQHGDFERELDRAVALYEELTARGGRGRARNRPGRRSPT